MSGNQLLPQWMALKSTIGWTKFGNYLQSTNPDGVLRFRWLANVSKLVLILPHSNASEERVFSMITKNKTSFRPNLKLDGTLASIITVKLAILSLVISTNPKKSYLREQKRQQWSTIGHTNNLVHKLNIGVLVSYSLFKYLTHFCALSDSMLTFLTHYCFKGLASLGYLWRYLKCSLQKGLLSLLEHHNQVMSTIPALFSAR